MTAREQFIGWLNDARSTELAQIPVLENHANDAKDYPEIRERDLQHLEETKRQAERLEELITELGGSISTMKTVIGKVTGFGHSVSTGIFPDELIKNFLSDYAAEHFEIASYISLIATAELIGEDWCVPVLEEILAEEVRMARWLEQNIPMATHESLRVVAGDYYQQYPDDSRRKTKKKGVVSKLAKPSLLATLLGVGALGAGATWYLRSQRGKTSNGLSQNNRSSLSQTTSGNPVSLPDETIVETVVVTIEDTGDQGIGDLNTGTLSSATTDRS